MENNLYDLAKTMRLAYLKNNFETIIEEAENNKPSYFDFLCNILELEKIDRYNKNVEKNLKTACFPNILTFDELDMDCFSIEISNRIKDIETLSFIEKGQNVILCGNPGVGKTHLATALGINACKLNKSVLFTSVPNLVIELKEKAESNQLSTFKKRFCSFDLVILDELGYVSFDKSASELLFNLLSTRNENKSIIITTNLSFNRWNEIFGDEVLTAAMVDRLTQRAYVLNIQGQSYRLKQTKEWLSENSDTGSAK